MLVAIVILTMVVLFILNVPIYISMLCAVVIYFASVDANLMIMIQKMMGGVQKTSLLAIPFFIMSGICMNYTGITRRMMNFAEKITGHLPGGLGQVNILLSTLMGGLSGSCIADAAMQSKILYPEMVRRGYGKGFSAAITAASSIITPVIPPGLSMITYSLVANVSVGRVFAAGIVPGIIMCITQMIICHITAKRRGYAPLLEKRASVKEVAEASKASVLALMMPVLIIGGIRSGIFTAAETGAVCVLYAVCVGVFAYKEFKFRHFVMALKETAVLSLSVLLIFGAAQGFAWMIANERVAASLTDFVLTYVRTPWQFMSIMVIFMVIAGCFMDGGAITVMLVPLLVPILNALGIDLIYFGIVYVVGVVFGNITPPVGNVMYTVCNVTGVKSKEFMKDILPFYLGFALDFAIFIFIPDIILFIPNLLYGA